MVKSGTTPTRWSTQNPIAPEKEGRQDQLEASRAAVKDVVAQFAPLRIVQLRALQGRAPTTARGL